MGNLVFLVSWCGLKCSVELSICDSILQSGEIRRKKRLSIYWWKNGSAIKTRLCHCVVPEICVWQGVASYQSLCQKARAYSFGADAGKSSYMRTDSPAHQADAVDKISQTLLQRRHNSSFRISIQIIPSLRKISTLLTQR